MALSPDSGAPQPRAFFCVTGARFIFRIRSRGLQQMCARLLGCWQNLTPCPRACSALLVVVIEVVFVVIVVVIFVVIAIESSQRDTS